MSISPPKTAARAKKGSAGADPRRLEKVRAVFVSLAKYINAKTIYENNPIVEKFAGAFYDALHAFFADEKELTLSVEQYQLKWNEEAVYDNREKKESIAFLLFKDGVGEITVQDGVDRSELEQFVDLIITEISSPSADVTIVDRLWQADFSRISYRVYDEAADEKQGEGTGSAGSPGEQQLSSNDHSNLAKSAASAHASADRSNESLGRHLRRMVERDHPRADERERERLYQELLESLFDVREKEFVEWRSGFSSFEEMDRLMWILDIMLDFTTSGMPEEAARDVVRIIERLVGYIAEEADISTLFALLDIQKTLVARGELVEGFEAVPQRIRHELTNAKFLLVLGRKAGRSRSDAPRILEYLGALGNNAVPAMREILALSNDQSVHEMTCDVLFGIAKDYLQAIVENLDLENPLEARDVVDLLGRLPAGEVPEVVSKIVASPDPEIRIHAIGYLSRIGSEEASHMLCTLLGDSDTGIRVATIAAVEDLDDPALVAKIRSMCFDEDIAERGMEELERLFRALGKLVGAEALPQIAHMASERSFLAINRVKARRSKLLAITALRQIAGPEAQKLLEKLAGDSDTLVKSKAQHAIDLLDEQEEMCTSGQSSETESGGE
jgi:hypothetical protein